MLPPIKEAITYPSSFSFFLQFHPLTEIKIHNRSVAHYAQFKEVAVTSLLQNVTHDINESNTTVLSLKGGSYTVYFL